MLYCSCLWQNPWDKHLKADLFCSQFWYFLSKIKRFCFFWTSGEVEYHVAMWQNIEDHIMTVGGRKTGEAEIGQSLEQSSSDLLFWRSPSEMSYHLSKVCTIVISGLVYQGVSHHYYPVITTHLPFCTSKHHCVGNWDSNM